MSADEPKIHIDTDWKAQAQAEKERLMAEEKAKAGQADSRAPGAPGGRGLPEPNFRALVSVLASQAMLGLGSFQDPDSRGVMIDLEGAQFSIDLLDVLEEKTKGNVTEEEATELRQVLAELRARYVQITRLVAEQMAAQAGAPEGAAPGSGVIQP